MLDYGIIPNCKLKILALSIMGKGHCPKGGVIMNKYELALVLSPALDEEARNAEVEKVQALLERFDGKIEKVDEWGKRKLAYEIKHANQGKGVKVNEGFFSFTTFEAPATAPAEIESRIRIMENVLRYLIVRKDA